jgi:plasmid maintenance system antidote protein VapI
VGRSSATATFIISAKPLSRRGVKQKTLVEAFGVTKGMVWRVVHDKNRL